MNNYRNIVWSLFVFMAYSGLSYGQGLPNEVIYEPDEGGYEEGYTPTKKLGTIDLSSTASNEPFRHLLWNGVVSWDKKTDYRDFGFKAMWGESALYKPKINRYIDLNEAQFRAGNPIYAPDPNATGAGQTFSCINAPFPSVTIDNIVEDAKWNPFLLSGQTIDNIARSIANPSINFMRWDIEQFNPEGWSEIIKGRQVWEGGKYRHRNNGGNTPEFRDIDDNSFYYQVQNRWSYVFSELFYKTKLFAGGQIKVWLYGSGPVGKMTPRYQPQFDDKGNITWKNVRFIWNNRNNINNKTVAETVDYMEPWDAIPTHGMFGIAQLDKSNQWVNTDILLLDNAPKSTLSVGKPTRFSITELGEVDNKMKRVRISLHGQDGTLRVADKDNYGVFFQDYRGTIQGNMPKGQHSLEMTVYPWEPIKDEEDGVLISAWTNMYIQRYHEPQKLGFMNWEPSPRTEGLFTTTLFDQRVYDALIAFINLQNYGIIHWDANATMKVNARIRESLILANRKIAPYKYHIENQTLCQTGVSLDNGVSWNEGGYSTKPFEQCYNGWWMQKRRDEKLQFPMFIATYNAQQRTILVAHLTSRTEGNMNYKIKVKIPNVGTYVYDVTSSKNLRYTVFRL